MTQTVSLGSEVVKFEIWDTAGQERYKSLAPMYYRGAAAALIVYDITSKESLDAAKSWVNELQPTGSLIALAGNKADLDANRAVEIETAQAYAKEMGILFMETSAKTGLNVTEIFQEVAKKLPKQTKEDQENTKGGFQMGNNSQSPSKSG